MPLFVAQETEPFEPIDVTQDTEPELDSADEYFIYIDVRDPEKPKEEGEVEPLSLIHI